MCSTLAKEIIAMSDSDLVNEYFCSVCELPDGELDDASHALVEVWHSFGLIQNGGIHGYLCSVGDLAETTEQHYRTVNLQRCGDLIGLAHDLWRQYWPHPSPDESDANDFRNQFGTELDAIEENFYDQEQQIIDKLAEVVQNIMKNG
jgi:Domain of unknown function (DUF4375)